MTRISTYIDIEMERGKAVARVALETAKATIRILIVDPQTDAEDKANGNYAISQINKLLETL